MASKAIFRRILLGIAAMAISIFGLSGLVTAQCYEAKNDGNETMECEITNENQVTVSNDVQQTAISGSVSIEQSYDYDSSNNGWMMQWDYWNPDSWQDNDKSFDNWWNGLHDWINRLASASSWSANYYGNDWKPNGNDWKPKWENWHPMSWLSHGQSYQNWHDQLMQYLEDQKPSWKNNWRGSGENDAKSGNVSNVSEINNYVSIKNQASCLKPIEHYKPVPSPTPAPSQPKCVTNCYKQDYEQRQGSGEANFGYEYGYGEYSEPVKEQPSPKEYCDTYCQNGKKPPAPEKPLKPIILPTEVEISNTNNVNITNNVSQTAVSGNVSVTGQANAGSAVTGDASNVSTVTNTIDIQNN